MDPAGSMARRLGVDQAEEDEVLLRRLTAGDKGALGLLYDRYAGSLLALLLRIIGDRAVAEDLLQEVFLRVWQRASTYQPGRGRPTTWIFGIAHNLAIDEVRRQRRRPLAMESQDAESRETLLRAIPAAEPDPADQAWVQLQRAQISAALSHLPDAQRAIIELSYFEGYTQSQIAARLDEPLGTVKTRLRLGMQKLREHLRRQGLTGELY